MRTLFLVLLIWFLTTLHSPLFGQSSDQSTVEHYSQPGLSLNYSPHSFRAWGKIQNSKMAFINGQVWHTSINLRNVKARVGSELIFTHWVQFPEDGLEGAKDQRIGVGLVPIHMILPFTEKSVTPFTSASLGVIFFNDRLPAVKGAALNYKLSVGMGLEIPLPSDHRFQLGYRIQHISNGNSSTENPGIDSHVFFANLIFSNW